EELREPLLEKKMTLDIEESVYTAVAEKAHGGKFGGRDIRRVIRTEIEDVVAETIIDNCDRVLSSISITAENGEIKVKAV
ncbi:MAG: ATP-dependent Clp protease ATP-binding subunit, partial [Ruminococcaceae bacterium]|nr:ATP-dependent Clp protease ATP-binding subunit [Oscillospiraceae bacterium]